MVVGLYDLDGVSLTPTPVDPVLLAGETFEWAGDVWLTDIRTLVDPPMRIVVAAPLAAFEEPFARASRRGLGVLLLVALAA